MEHLTLPNKNIYTRAQFNTVLEIYRQIAFKNTEYNGVVDFFDFYGCYYLWFQKGSGREYYGYSLDSVFPYSKVTKIDSTFYNKVNYIKEKVVDAIWHSVLRELRHALDGDGFSRYPFYNSPIGKKILINSGYKLKYIQHIHEHYASFGYKKYQNEIDSKLIDVHIHVFCYLLNLSKEVAEKIKEHYKIHDKFILFKDLFVSLLKNNIDILDMKNVFLLPHWMPYYGKKSWAKACDVLYDLLTQDTLKENIYNIDRAFDLQHNTNILFDKDGNYFYSLRRRHLNRRSEFEKLEQFIPVCSNGIQKLMIANLS